MIRYMYPNGRFKAFTLSYDDGVQQDKRLVSMLNHFHVKATFNLNSGLQNQNGSWMMDGCRIERIPKEEIEALYRGHEVAVHGFTHPFLKGMPREVMMQEIMKDRIMLEQLVGYPVRGMAYPYGAYDAAAIEVLRRSGIEYSRTVAGQEGFQLPECPLEWRPTCHHGSPRLLDLAKSYVVLSEEKLSLFYVWGHSYEFDLTNNWEIMEYLLECISHRNDIWYTTNMGLMDYVNAMHALKFSAACSLVYNPGGISVWLKVNERIIEVLPGATTRLLQDDYGKE
ncbi:MAG: polysaccharide deacetylase [Paenibacillaceae bacterium]|jgi:hypothetical protein|nr:polysaccharide deacetylase [Paenibacillaceae bacterium]